MEHPSSTAPDSFLAIARRLALLDEDAARKLEEERQAAGVPAAQLALRHGFLDPVQVDIVEAILAPGDVVPGFEILDLIGQGGMGVVFRARQKSLDRVVAIKTILVSQMHDQTTLARFQQEAFAVARLRHPNIVAAYDLGQKDGRFYFVMELIEGEDVQRAIDRDGPFHEWVVWKLVRQAAAGLSHAAAAGIIHRDIKPANLLLVDPPAGFDLPGGLKMVKITDFGLAFLTRDVDVKTRLTQANTAIGSPHYLAPEQLESDAFDHRVDIYSLGATAYHMLSGEPPFGAKSLAQLITKKLSTQSLNLREEFPDISPASAELVSRMTKRDPAERVGDYSQLIAQIDALRLRPPSGVSPPRTAPTSATQLIRSDPTPGELSVNTLDWKRSSPPKTPPRPGRRKFLATLGGGAVAASALAAGGWALFSARSRPSRTLAPAGLGLSLFDGLSLSGWQTHSGGWMIKRNSEGGRVLSGTSGRSTHALVKRVGNKKTPLIQFSLQVVIQLHGATAAEIEFGANSVDADGKRLVGRLERLSCSLGHRANDSATFVRLSDLKALPDAGSNPHTLTIERQPGQWWLLLDDHPVGTAPLRAEEQNAPWISLVAEDGEAWFSDVTLQELA